MAPAQVQGCLLSLGCGLTLLAGALGLGAVLVMPYASIAFLLSMLHAVFLVSLAPPVHSIRLLHWLAYGVSLIGSAFVLSYAFGQAQLYVLAFFFVGVVFVEIFAVSWRSQWRRGLLQIVFVSLGLLAVPLAVCVRDPNVLTDTIGEGQLVHTRFLLSLGADVRARNSAALNATRQTDIDQPGNLEMMRLVLDYGADPNVAVNSAGASVLTATVYDNRLDMMRLLLASGADPNRDYSSALFEALRFNRPAMVDLLVAHGADVHARNERGWSTLFVAPTAALARFLIERGVALDVRDRAGRTALFGVVEQADVAAVAVLVEHGFDVNARDTSGRTPLIVAADYNGRAYGDKLVGSRGYAVVAYLLDHNADIDAVDRNGDSALDVARRQNYQDIVALLRAAGARE